MIHLGSIDWVLLGLAYPLGSRTWWVVWVLVVVVAALGAAGLVVFTSVYCRGRGDDRDERHHR